VAFEEVRTHLDLETQRQWNDLVIERTTPALLGLFSRIVLLAQALHPTGGLPHAAEMTHCLDHLWQVPMS
jgi:hypothetical protein